MHRVWMLMVLRISILTAAKSQILVDIPAPRLSQSIGLQCQFLTPYFLAIWRFLHGREYPANIRPAPIISAGIPSSRVFRAAIVARLTRTVATLAEASRTA